jgi:hypothetical protein
MTNTFIRKVTAERKVLGIVNAITPGSQQLAGLSAAAIDVWRRQALTPGVDYIAQRLLKISSLCQLLSDRSHESLQSLDPILIGKIDAELVELKGAMLQEGIVASDQMFLSTT